MILAEMDLLVCSFMDMPVELVSCLLVFPPSLHLLNRVLFIGVRSVSHTQVLASLPFSPSITSLKRGTCLFVFFKSLLIPYYLTDTIVVSNSLIKNTPWKIDNSIRQYWAAPDCFLGACIYSGNNFDSKGSLYFVHFVDRELVYMLWR